MPRFAESVSYCASLPPPVLEAGGGIGKAAGSQVAGRGANGITEQLSPTTLLATPVAGGPHGESPEITVTLSESTLGAIRDAVASGEYASADEIVRDALRDWKVKHRVSQIELDEIRRLVQEGADSGPGIDADLVFGLRAKYAAMAEE